MNKKIPTPLALIIVLVCSIVAGGIVLWQVNL